MANAMPLFRAWSTGERGIGINPKRRKSFLGLAALRFLTMECEVQTAGSSSV